MGLLNKALPKAPTGLIGVIADKLKSKKKGMASMPGQSPLGMSSSASPGASLSASSGQRSLLG